MKKKSLVLLILALPLLGQNTAIYPTRAATLSDLTVAQNFYQSATLTQAVGLSDSTLLVSNTLGVRGAPIILYLDPLTGNMEEVKCSGFTSTSFTGCQRSFDNTVATSHDVGARVVNFVSPFYLNQIIAEVIAIENDLRAHTWWAGSTTTLNGVTLISPTISDFTNAVHTHQNAASGGQLVLGAFDPTVLTGTGTKLCTVSGATGNTFLVVFDANGNCTQSVATLTGDGTLSTGGTGSSTLSLGSPTTQGALGSPTAGTAKFCSDCNVASPCTAGGGGAWAFANGVSWSCPF